MAQTIYELHERDENGLLPATVHPLEPAVVYQHKIITVALSPCNDVDFPVTMYLHWDIQGFYLGERCQNLDAKGVSIKMKL